MVDSKCQFSVYLRRQRNAKDSKSTTQEDDLSFTIICWFIIESWQVWWLCIGFVASLDGLRDATNSIVCDFQSSNRIFVARCIDQSLVGDSICNRGHNSDVDGRKSGRTEYRPKRNCGQTHRSRRSAFANRVTVNSHAKHRKPSGLSHF
jgi:hypothetical protein